MTNLFDLEAPCIHKLCMSMCFALSSPLLQTRHIVPVASRCSFCPHEMPRSLATLWIHNPSDAVLTTASSPLSVVDSDTTCCFLVHTFQKMSTSYGSLQLTPTARRLCCLSILHPSTLQRSPLCCQWYKPSASGFSTRCLPILVTRSRSDADRFSIAQHTCIAANFKSRRSCDKQLVAA